MIQLVHTHVTLLCKGDPTVCAGALTSTSHYRGIGQSECVEDECHSSCLATLQVVGRCLNHVYFLQTTLTRATSSKLLDKSQAQSHKLNQQLTPDTSRPLTNFQRLHLCLQQVTRAPPATQGRWVTQLLMGCLLQIATHLASQVTPPRQPPLRYYNKSDVMVQLDFLFDNCTPWELAYKYVLECWY